MDSIPIGLVRYYKEEMQKHITNDRFTTSPEILLQKHNQVLNTVLKRLELLQKSAVGENQKFVIEEELGKYFKTFEEENWKKLGWCGSSTVEPAIGIDLGTVNSVIGVFVKGQVKIIQTTAGTNNTPSYVAFDQDGVTVGKSAYDMRYNDPENTLYDVKRLIGRPMTDEVVQKDIKDWPFRVADNNNQPNLVVLGRSYLPEDISCMVLASLKELAEKNLKCKISKAVITVPAYFNNDQRHATLKAAEQANLQVLHILSEPTAAAIAYKLQRYNEEAKHVVVFDLGGGTFDVSVLNTNKKIEVLAIGGNAHLGGEDFDKRLRSHCLKKFEDKTSIKVSSLRGSVSETLADRRKMVSLLAKCEEAKKQLSFAETTTVFCEMFANGTNLEVKISRSEFENLIMDYLNEMISIVHNTLLEAKVSKENVDDIVMIGGATRIPKLQEMLSDYFDGRALNLSINPDEAVAHGAAMQAALKNKVKEAEEMLNNLSSIQDVTPLSYGIEAEMNGKFGQFSVLIPKNTKYPTEHTSHYTTSSDFQTFIQIRIFQGENKLAAKNVFLGEFLLSGVPPARAGHERIQVITKITEMGVLNVEARLKSTGKSAGKSLQVIQNKTQFSK